MKLVAEQLKLTLGQTEHLVFKQRIKNDNICELDFADDLKTSLEIANRHGRVEITGIVDTAVQLSCSRCLTDFIQPVHAQFVAQVVSNDSDCPESEEHVDVLCLSESGQLELTDFVIETVDLHLPWVPLCRPECSGLCPQCGANLNEGSCSCRSDKIDPRWQVLKQWQQS